ncbi:MAG: hypothetical protein IJU35_07460 [Paludibacteraceae bacterium]|nr:hypothetical protein [Paludibacteraceae bacterium]
MKLKHFLLAALVALFAACTSKESLIQDYEKACEVGDIVKAEKIGKKLEGKTLSTEEQERITKATLKLSAKQMELLK